MLDVEFLVDVLSKSNDKENPFMNFMSLEWRWWQPVLVFWGKISPLCHENRIQKTREEKYSWWQHMGLQLNLSFSTFRNRIAASLQCTNSLGHINKKKKNQFFFYFFFSKKRVVFLCLELLCFPWSIGMLFTGCEVSPK